MVDPRPKPASWWFKFTKLELGQGGLISMPIDLDQVPIWKFRINHMAVWMTWLML